MEQEPERHARSRAAGRTLGTQPPAARAADRVARGLRRAGPPQPGAPSAEGPRASTRPSHVDLGVVPPFTVRGVTCDDASRPRLERRALPRAQPGLSSSSATAIDVASFRASKIQLEGEPFQDTLPTVRPSGCSPRDAVGKTFRIAIGDGLIDVYGQPLVGPRRAVVRHDPAAVRARSCTRRTGLHVLDPRFEIPQWVIATQAVTAVRVAAVPGRSPRTTSRSQASRPASATTPPGKRVFDKTLPGRRAPRRRPARRSAPRARRHRARPRDRDRDRRARHPERADDWFEPRSIAWIQVTQARPVARGSTARQRRRVDPRHRADAASSRRSPASTTLVVEERRGAPARPATDRRRRPRRRSSCRRAGATMPTSDDGAVGAAARRRSRRRLDVHRDRRATRRRSARDDALLVRHRRSLHLQAGREGLRQGLGALDAQRRQPGPRAARARARPSRTRSPTRAATSSRAAPRRSPTQGGFDLEVTLPANANLGTATFTFSTRRTHARATRSRSRSSARPRTRSRSTTTSSTRARRRSCSARASR